MTKVNRDVPRLVSDVSRSLMMFAIVVPITLIVPVALLFTGLETNIREASVSALLIAWATIGLASTIITVLVFRKADAAELRRWLRATTPRSTSGKLQLEFSGASALGFAISGSAIAVAAVLLLSLNPEFRDEPIIVGSGIAVVVCSLLMTITAYAVRYAREYADAASCLDFPGDREPIFTDFLYLSTLVSVSFSGSDVQVRSTKVRRIMLMHSLISFAFNTIIVALLVSVLVTSAVPR